MKLPQNVHVTVSAKQLEKYEINVIGRTVGRSSGYRGQVSG
jgi:hypothetical protein